ncbi:class I SAM-dependent methyltransferase [Candidatus Methylopumilus universalis]|nr:class I SAM-dependent methyltransferase [Candidatus Methylopumilus universalis]
MSFTEAVKQFPSRNDLYNYMHHYLWHIAPKEILQHRRYFSQDMRGFGEDAFHAMWWTIFREFKPKLVLEIGVYRGQVCSLWGLISKLNGFKCEVHGISPFSPAGDHVSNYLANLDYLEDTLESHRKFHLLEPNFMSYYSTDKKAIDYIRCHKWDLIYIDGNHDYDVVLSDYLHCKDSLAKGGILVIDDSSLYTDYIPPSFSFAGHIGPSRVVENFAMKELDFIGAVGHNNVFMNKNGN